MKADSLSMANLPAQWIIPSLPQTLTVLYAPTHVQIKMQVTQMNVHTNMVLKHIVYPYREAHSFQFSLKRTFITGYFQYKNTKIQNGQKLDSKMSIY